MSRLLKIANIIIAIVLIFLLGYLAGKRYDIVWDDENHFIGISYNSNEQKIKQLMALIESQYVDQVDTDSIVETTMQNILSNLDPHSVYLSKDLVKQTDQEIDGDFHSIGMHCRYANDTLIITEVVKNSPNKNKLRAGDKVLMVNGKDIVGKNDQAITKIFGGKTNRYELSIIRDNEIKKVSVKKEDFTINTISAAIMLDDNTGFIKLDRFGKRTADEFKTAIQSLQKKGMKRMILDLRGNGGGLMDAAVEVTDEFLPEKKLIVSMKGRAQELVKEYSTSNGNFLKGECYVLIDEQSASASEIVAGALQEHDRATIVGRRSFGKGLVQKVVEMSDGTKVRLTVARYYTPSGRGIQKPYVEGEKENYQKDLMERTQNGELFYEDSIKKDESLKYKTPSGKTVYGGGGIIPDVFIPIDAVNYGDWYFHIEGVQAIEVFSVNYLTQHPNWYQLKSPIELNSNLEKENIAKPFAAYFDINYRSLDQKQKNLITHLVTAHLQKAIFGRDAYYQNISEIDPMVKAVLKL